MRQDHKVYIRIEREGNFDIVLDLIMDYQLKNHPDKNDYIECVELGLRERSFSSKYPMKDEYGLSSNVYIAGDYTDPLQTYTAHTAQRKEKRDQGRKGFLANDVVGLNMKRLSMIDLSLPVREIEQEINDKQEEMSGL